MLLYSLKPNLKREILPQLGIVLTLCVVFYLGIILNLLLLGLDLSNYIKILIIAILAVLFAMESVLLYSRASNANYNFHEDKITLEGKKPNSMPYRNVTNMSMKQNLVDKLFNTYTINLEPGFRIRFINNGSQVYVYLQKLVNRARILKR